MRGVLLDGMGGVRGGVVVVQLPTPGKMDYMITLTR